MKKILKSLQIVYVILLTVFLIIAVLKISQTENEKEYYKNFVQELNKGKSINGIIFTPQYQTLTTYFHNNSSLISINIIYNQDYITNLYITNIKNPENITIKINNITLEHLEKRYLEINNQTETSSFTFEIENNKYHFISIYLGWNRSLPYIQIDKI